MSKENVTKEQATLRDQLQKLSTILHNELHDSKSRLFGELATIIEATISDKAQSKAVKDLVSNLVYGNTNMQRVFEYQLKQLSEANGFELYSAPDDLFVTAANSYAE